MIDKNTPNKPKKVETYTEDMARVLEDDQSGIIKKIIHQQEEHEKDRRNFSPESRKNKIEMLISFILVIASFVVLFLSISKNGSNTVPVHEQIAPMIFLDKTFFIEAAGLESGEIIGSIRNEIESVDLKERGVEGLYFAENKKTIGARRFLSLLQANFAAPAEPFMSDKFLAGVYNGANKDFFLLLKFRSMIDAFEPMRKWEDKMLSDLGPLFGVEESDYPAYVSFKDGVVENKNARILNSQEEKALLMYVFLDDTSVVISNSIEAIHEIAVRLYSAAASSI